MEACGRFTWLRLYITSRERYMIHELNYHGKWLTSHYELQHYNSGFVFPSYYSGLARGQSGGVGGGYHLLGYSVLLYVCV